MIANKVFLVFVILSTLLLLGLKIFILKQKNKKQTFIFITYFNYTVLFMIICNLGYFSLVFFKEFFNIKNIIFEYIIYFGLSFCATFFLLFCVTFIKQSLNINKFIISIIFLPQIFTNIILLTNKWHNYFYISYETSNKYLFGSYFPIAIFFIWVYVVIGIGLLIWFSVKTGKFASQQAKWIIIGSITPMMLNGSWLIGNAIDNESLRFFSNYDLTPISFTLTFICFAYAIFKSKFLSLVPIPKEIIINNMSDCYIVINDEFEIIEFNEPFKSKFGKLFDFDIGDSIINVLNQRENLIFDITNFKEIIKEIRPNIRSKPYERNIILDDFNEWYDIEFARSDSKLNPIIIMLFKNITEHKARIEQTKQHQEVLTKQDRLASLGQLAGGMAHDINNPASAIRDGEYVLSKLFDRIINEDLTLEKREKTIDNIKVILNEISECSQSILTIVGSVRNHMRNVSATNNCKFSTEKLANHIQVLVDHELKKKHCSLDINYEPIEINTDFGKLSQVLTNLILNAVQAYGDKKGTIAISIKKENNNALIEVQDFAGGIPEHITDSIFNEMLTTKGTEGTGLGLYMCHLLITAHLEGDITFKTVVGTGTTFFITVPLEPKT